MAQRKPRTGTFWQSVRDELVESAKWLVWLAGVGAVGGGIAGFQMGGVVGLAIGVVAGAIAGGVVWWVLTDNHVL